jgi:hypothetical protein
MGSERLTSATVPTGRRKVVNPPAWGAGNRRFESGRPDHARVVQEQNVSVTWRRWGCDSLRGHYNPRVNPEYKRKLEEAEAELQRRRQLQGLDKPTPMPDLERMPLGCWIWVLGLIGALIYFVYTVIMKRPA